MSGAGNATPSDAPREFNWWYQGQILGIGWLFGGLLFTVFPLVFLFTAKVTPVAVAGLCCLGLLMLGSSVAILKGYENGRYVLCLDRVEKWNTLNQKVQEVKFADVTSIVFYVGSVGLRNDRNAEYIGQDTVLIPNALNGFEEIMYRALNLCTQAKLSCEPSFVDELDPQVLTVVAGPLEYSSPNGCVTISEQVLKSTAANLTGSWKLRALKSVIMLSTSRSRATANRCFLQFPEGAISYGVDSLGGKLLPFARSLIAHRGPATRVIDASGDFVRLSKSLN